MKKRFGCNLLILCTILMLGSAVTVTQTPRFVSDSTGQNISFRCSVDEAGYRFYWYQQLPGKTELKVLGYLSSFDRDLQEKHQDLQNRLKAKWEDSNSKEMRLDVLSLQASDTGFYLCAAVYTLNEVGIEAGTKLSVRITCISNIFPGVLLFCIYAHRITLVCLAQGFHYEWPLDVIWERDGQKITRLSSATEPIKKQGECNFATASRMSVLAQEWQKGHNYSCHVNQTGQVVSDWVKSSPDHKRASVTTATSFFLSFFLSFSFFLSSESSSGVSEVQLSLYAGQFIFLLLGAKSLAYSVILGIYKIYKKKGKRQPSWLTKNNFVILFKHHIDYNLLNKPQMTFFTQHTKPTNYGDGFTLRVIKPHWSLT
uniref:Ig-like domain-containing protein n=1 Tax=Laticauda laticaudata TaxID=8630 RepID=A0A8C5SYY1_LATLA